MLKSKVGEDGVVIDTDIDIVKNHIETIDKLREELKVANQGRFRDGPRSFLAATAPMPPPSTAFLPSGVVAEATAELSKDRKALEEMKMKGKEASGSGVDGDDDESTEPTAVRVELIDGLM